MAGEIVLDERIEKIVPDEERALLGNLEERVVYLLKKFQELKKERDELVVTLNAEKVRMTLLEKKLELLSQDREKVKTRIDQLLLRLKSVDI